MKWPEASGLQKVDPPLGKRPSYAPAPASIWIQNFLSRNFPLEVRAYANLKRLSERHRLNQHAFASASDAGEDSSLRSWCITAWTKPKHLRKSCKKEIQQSSKKMRSLTTSRQRNCVHAEYGWPWLDKPWQPFPTRDSSCGRGECRRGTGRN